MARETSSFSGRIGERRRSMLSLSIIISLSCIVLFTQVVEGKVLCYVCSWSAYGSQNITDTCSHYHFQPDYGITIECELGCEAVGTRKSRNENVVNFYKNCIPESKKGTQLEDTCVETEEKMQFVRTCECTSNLCNAGGRLEGFTGVTMVVAVAITIIFKSSGSLI